MNSLGLMFYNIFIRYILLWTNVEYVNAQKIYLIRWNDKWRDMYDKTIYQRSKLNVSDLSKCKQNPNNDRNVKPVAWGGRTSLCRRRSTYNNNQLSLLQYIINNRNLSTSVSEACFCCLPRSECRRSSGRHTSSQSWENQALKNAVEPAWKACGCESCLTSLP